MKLVDWMGHTDDVYRVVKLEVTDPQRPHEDLSKIVGIAKRHFDGSKYLKKLSHRGFKNGMENLGLRKGQLKKL